MGKHLCSWEWLGGECSSSNRNRIKCESLSILPCFSSVSCKLIVLSYQDDYAWFLAMVKSWLISSRVFQFFNKIAMFVSCGRMGQFRCFTAIGLVPIFRSFEYYGLTRDRFDSVIILGSAFTLCIGISKYSLYHPSFTCFISIFG